ncbi:MAG: hypothetical protein LBP53_00790 [Candidatus Peribacteria bacterium]|jgi:hypothetical protein|nr:hypothetical protein [Candidatus Peribacteria bacterium]
MKKLLLLFLPFLLLVVLAGCANFGTSSLPYPSTPPTATSGEGVFDISIETYTGEGLVDQTYYFAKYDDTYVLLYVDNVSE